MIWRSWHTAQEAIQDLSLCQTSPWVIACSEETLVSQRSFQGRNWRDRTLLLYSRIQGKTKLRFSCTNHLEYPYHLQLKWKLFLKCPRIIYYFMHFLCSLYLNLRLFCLLRTPRQRLHVRMSFRFYHGTLFLTLHKPCCFLKWIQLLDVLQVIPGASTSYSYEANNIWGLLYHLLVQAPYWSVFWLPFKVNRIFCLRLNQFEGYL